MDYDSEAFDLIANLPKECLMPEFDREIGNEPLAREDFGVYVYGVEKNLMLLFDIIGKNEHGLLAQHQRTADFHYYLFLALLEQMETKPRATFQTLDTSIIKQINVLIDKCIKRSIIDSNLYGRCLAHYKGKLTEDKWKKNIGNIYGLLGMAKVNNFVGENSFSILITLFCCRFTVTNLNFN